MAQATLLSLAEPAARDLLLPPAPDGADPLATFHPLRPTPRAAGTDALLDAVATTWEGPWTRRALVALIERTLASPAPDPALVARWFGALAAADPAAAALIVPTLPDPMLAALDAGVVARLLATPDRDARLALARRLGRRRSDR